MGSWDGDPEALLDRRGRCRADPRAASLLASADAERAALGIPRRNAPFETLDAVRTTVASEMPPEPPSFRTAMHQAMDGAP